MDLRDVLAHRVPGARSTVVVAAFPEVRVTRRTTVDVVRVAQRLLEIGTPTLLQNYTHVLPLASREA